MKMPALLQKMTFRPSDGLKNKKIMKTDNTATTLEEMSPQEKQSLFDSMNFETELMDLIRKRAGQLGDCSITCIATCIGKEVRLTVSTVSQKNGALESELNITK